jgi:tripartite-type tricarboxylate transporter receptor subunit TctC
MKRIVAGTCVVLSAVFGGFHAPVIAADDFPSRPISFIVPYPPGGANDNVARLLAKKISENVGKPVIVENKPGASGMIAGEFLANAPADGYTIMIDQSSIVANPSLYASVRFNVKKDLATVTQPANMLHLLVVNANVPARTLPELIALAKSQPGTLNYSSTGSGGPQHIAMEALKRAAGVDIMHVPYKGGAPALLAAMTGETQMTLLSVATTLPQLKAGKLRAIAMLGAERSKVLPDVPTFAELGFKGLATPWLGIFVPAGTPAPAIQRLNAEFAKALKDPQVRERMEAQAFEAVGSSPEAFAKFLDAELAANAKLIREIGIKPD